MNKRQREGFKCECCGKWHDYAPTDFGFQLPDDAWSLPQDQLAQRMAANEDYCAIDKKRFFIRCVAMIPFKHIDGHFGWGLWAEVSKRDFFQYHDHHGKEGERVKPFVGRVANALPGYRSLRGKEVELLPSASNLRPKLRFPATSRHLMALEQRAGVGQARHHELVHENMPGAME